MAFFTLGGFARGAADEYNDYLRSKRENAAERDLARAKAIDEWKDVGKEKMDAEIEGKKAVAAIEYGYKKAKTEAEDAPYRESAINYMTAYGFASDEEDAARKLKERFGNDGKAAITAFTQGTGETMLGHKKTVDNANSASDEDLLDGVDTTPLSPKTQAAVDAEAAREPVDYSTFKTKLINDTFRENSTRGDYGIAYPDVPRSLTHNQDDVMNSAIKLGDRFSKAAAKMGKSVAMDRGKAVDETYFTIFAPHQNNKDDKMLTKDKEINPAYSFAASEDTRQEAAARLVNTIGIKGVNALFPDGSSQTAQEKVIIDLASKYAEKNGLGSDSSGADPSTKSAVPDQAIEPQDDSVMDIEKLPSKLPESPAHPAEAIIKSGVNVQSLSGVDRTQVDSLIKNYLATSPMSMDQKRQLLEKLGYTD